MAARHSRNICNAAKNKFIKDTVTDNKKKLFKYIKSKKNDVARVSPLIDKQGKRKTEDDKIAKIINEH